MLGRGAQKKSNRYFSLTQSSQHERGRLPGLIQPFVDQMRRGSAHVNASQKIFTNIYSRFQTFHRMGSSQERAAFFKPTLLVVTRHPGGPPGRPIIHPALPLRAFLHYPKFYKVAEFMNARYDFLVYRRFLTNARAWGAKKKRIAKSMNEGDCLDSFNHLWIK